MCYFLLLFTRFHMVTLCYPRTHLRGEYMRERMWLRRYSSSSINQEAGGLILSSPGVSLGKILNPDLPLMCVHECYALKKCICVSE